VETARNAEKNAGEAEASARRGMWEMTVLAAGAVLGAIWTVVADRRRTNEMKRPVSSLESSLVRAEERTP
jgi:hypothetical protein